MGTKIHNLIIYPILENCKFWGVTAIASDPSSPTVGANVGKIRTALPSNTMHTEPSHVL